MSSKYMSVTPPIGHIAEGDAIVLQGRPLLRNKPGRVAVQVGEKGVRPFPRLADFGDIGRVAPVQQGGVDTGSADDEGIRRGGGAQRLQRPEHLRPLWGK